MYPESKQKVVFYAFFSGHGYWRDNSSTILLPDEPDKELRFFDLQHKLKVFGDEQRWRTKVYTIGIFDCCRGTVNETDWKGDTHSSANHIFVFAAKVGDLASVKDKMTIKMIDHLNKKRE